MTGQTHDGDADRTGPMDGRPDDARRTPGQGRTPFRPARLIAVPIAPEGPAIPISHPDERVPAAPSPRPRGSQGLLKALGLNTSQAAGLIAYLVGLPAGKTPWTLAQVERLLFLREMYQGRLGEDEHRPADRD
jgi:hypothetical protein